MSGPDWDPELYAGSAAHYAVGRWAYPPELAGAFAAELGLDGTGRLLDVGCGPGSLTLLLAPLFAETVGIDADADMVAEARRRASGTSGVRFERMLAEDLPGGLGAFDVVTFAQSFHWLDRPRVAAAVRTMLVPGGVSAVVHATTHHGVEPSAQLPHPRPPHDEIGALVRRYLGPVRRAGSRLVPDDPPDDFETVLRSAGFTGPRRFEVPGRVVVRTADQVVAAYFSLSSSTPHLFGGRRAAFEADLRRLLRDAAPDGLFAEQAREIAVDLWTP